NRGAAIGLVVLALVAIAGAAAPLIAPANPNSQEISQRLRAPLQGGAHLLGTDQLGRDITSRLIYASRIALLVGITVVAISAAIGVTLGLLAGFYGVESTIW